MQLAEQVVSLELSKQLKELGIRQESLFYWYIFPNGSYTLCYTIQHSHNTEWCNAFTVAELFDMIPAMITIPGREPFDGFWLHINKTTAKNIQYIIGYICDTFKAEDLTVPYFGDIYRKTYDEHLADALAKMLIYLIENNILHPNRDKPA